MGLLWLRMKVAVWEMVERCRVAQRYWRRSSLFRKVDLALWAAYASHSPFKISKNFLRERGIANIYSYGETPLTTMELIANSCGLTATDHVVELGCGTGRACFWLRCFVGCQTTGIEFIPEYVVKAHLLQQRFHIDKISFILTDMAYAELFSATAVYLYGTSMEEEEIGALAPVLDKLPRGAKLITVSWHFKEFFHTPAFSVVKQFSAPFPWGYADVYLQIKE